MRKIFLFVILSTTALLLQSCLKDKITRTYDVYEPVYKDRAEVLAGIRSSAPVQMQSPGKIYLYGNYIFLNDVNKGVHVIDNSNPSNPVVKAFIDIPGNADIAVKGTTLYADLYTDLLAIDISNPLAASLQKVVPGVFPERIYAAGFIADTTKVIVGWNKKTITETAPAVTAGRNWILADVFMMSPGASGSSAASAPGIAGSMSRFAVVNNYLYAVNTYSVNVVDISNSNMPVLANTVYAGSNIETLYPFKDKLFIGSSNGMFIYNINNPVSPVREGGFAHARACDPVVADDNYAFVTLRAGTFCQGTNNQLDVINVQQLQTPSLVKTYGFTNPHGLAKDGNLLFICDGKDGLKVYDAANVMNLRLLDKINNLETYDIIAWNHKALVVAKGGLYQYDYTNPSSLTLISKITTAP